VSFFLTVFPLGQNAVTKERGHKQLQED